VAIFKEEEKTRREEGQRRKGSTKWGGVTPGGGEEKRRRFLLFHQVWVDKKEVSSLYVREWDPIVAALPCVRVTSFLGASILGASILGANSRRGGGKHRRIQLRFGRKLQNDIRRGGKRPERQRDGEMTEQKEGRSDGREKGRQ